MISRPENNRCICPFDDREGLSSFSDWMPGELPPIMTDDSKLIADLEKGLKSEKSISCIICINGTVVTCYFVGFSGRAGQIGRRSNDESKSFGTCHSATLNSDYCHNRRLCPNAIQNQCEFKGNAEDE